MKKFKERYSYWKIWSKLNTNTRVFKILVLFRLANNPSFEYFLSVSRALDIYTKTLERLEREFKTLTLGTPISLTEGDLKDD